MPQQSLIVIGTTISIQVKATHTKKKQTQQLPLNIAYQSRCSSCGNTWWLDVGYGGELWLSFDSSQSRRTSSLCCPWTASSPGSDNIQPSSHLDFTSPSLSLSFPPRGSAPTYSLFQFLNLPAEQMVNTRQVIIIDPTSYSSAASAKSWDTQDA